MSHVSVLHNACFAHEYTCVESAPMVRAAPRFPATCILLCFALACGGPGSATVLRTPDGAGSTKPSRSLRERVADEVDPGPQKPFWPTLPDDVRADIERTAKASKDPKERLAQAQKRLATWSFDFAGSNVSLQTDALRACFEGVYLAEPLALSTDGTQENIAAAALLARFYGVLEHLPWYIEFLKDFGQAAQGNAESKSAQRRVDLSANVKPLEAVGVVAKATRPHLFAKILRAGAPPDALAEAFLYAAQRASRTGDINRARELLAEYIRLRGTNADVEDYLLVARAERRGLDRKASAAATQHANALAEKSPNSTKFHRKLRAADEGLRQLDALMALGDSHDFASELRRFDLLLSLERQDDARVLAAKLTKDHPQDARVLVRSIRIKWDAITMQGKFIESAVAAADLLEDPRLANKDGDYYSLYLGLLGGRLSREVIPLFATNADNAAQKLVSHLEQLRNAAMGLSAFDPGRAAAVLFLLDHLAPLLRGGQNADIDGLMKAMRAWLPDALALHRKYPDVPEIDQIVLSVAPFSSDRALAFSAVASRPTRAPEVEPELYLQRARTAVMLAAYLATDEALATARKLTGEVPPVDDSAPDSPREALLGDLDSIEARMKKDSKLFARAREHYEVARRSGDKDVRARATHNLGFALHALGDDASAEEMFLASANQESPRRWLSVLNALMLPGNAAARLGTLRNIAEKTREGTRPPYIVSVWLSKVTDDPSESAKAAWEALEEMDGAKTQLTTGAYALGIDSQGSFQLNLGTSPHLVLHELKVQAYANLWLMHDLPLSHAELEKRARAFKAPPNMSKPGKASKPKT